VTSYETTPAASVLRYWTWIAGVVVAGLHVSVALVMFAAATVPAASDVVHVSSFGWLPIVTL
jgi:hypothetical protein